MPELNAAALIREDTFTIKVRFLSYNDWKEDAPTYDPDVLDISRLSVKEYTYVCTFPVQPEQFVIVPARGVPTLAVVSKVDPGMTLEPNATKKYGWVIATVDVQGFYDNLKKNEKINQLLQKAYVTNARAQFRNAILGGLGETERLAITDMLGGK